MIHPWEKNRPISACYPGGLSGQSDKKISRHLRPILDIDTCIQCSFCWIYCPEGCIKRDDPFKIDYNACRGCGVCATECPQKSIRMVREDQL